MKIEKFEDIEAWQEARKLVNRIYSLLGVAGLKKDYSLADQTRRTAISIMANIAEGFSRHSDKEFIQFLFIAMSSSAEVQSHLYIALNQGYIDKEQFNEIYTQADKTAKLISGLIKYLRTKPTK